MGHLSRRKTVQNIDKRSLCNCQSLQKKQKKGAQKRGRIFSQAGRTAFLKAGHVTVHRHIRKRLDSDRKSDVLEWKFLEMRERRQENEALQQS